MKKNITKSKWLPTIIAFTSGFLLTELVYAADVAPATKEELPGSTQPGLIGRFLQPTSNQPVKAPPSVLKKEEKPSSLGPQAAKIKFKLVKIILEGNHIYSDQQIQALYQNKINTVITVEQLQSIVQDITNYYRNNGYILSRAILPPQHVHDGIVKIRVLEGFIDQVKVVGQPRGAKRILQAYGDKISSSRPLQIKDMEYYLRLANEIPGMQARAVLEPSKKNVGASDLDLTALEKTFNASISYDNYGTRYIGPQQITTNLGFNSIFTSGDATRLTYATTATQKQMSFYDGSYQWYAGTHGLTFTLGKNRSVTQPGFVLRTLDVFGEAVSYYGAFQYPLIRTRDQNMTLDGGFNYLDSSVSSLGSLLYMDHLRTIRFGGNYSFADRFMGSNMLAAHLEQGLSVMNASTNTHSTTTSRFGGDANFTKIYAQFARLQAIHSPFSAYFILTGQDVFRPILASEQFSFGGSQLGRGYDPAEIIGDRGLASSIELRMDKATGWRELQSLEPYVFYDVGAIWNRKNVINVPTKQTAMSTGFGSRFVFNNYLTGNLMWAQPLTKTVAAEQLIGRGKRPRVFFSIVASI